MPRALRGLVCEAERWCGRSGGRRVMRTALVSGLIQRAKLIERAMPAVERSCFQRRHSVVSVCNKAHACDTLEMKKKIRWRCQRR